MLYTELQNWFRLKYSRLNLLLEKAYCTERSKPPPAQSPERKRGRGYTGNSGEVKCVRLDVASGDMSCED